MQYRRLCAVSFMGVIQKLCLHGLALNVCVRVRFRFA